MNKEPHTTDKVLFEIVRDDQAAMPYQVVYYTELNEKERDEAIDRAMAAEPVFNGFIDAAHLELAKSAIAGCLSQLNSGASFAADEFEQVIAAYLAG